jgi:hypothetical protein
MVTHTKRNATGQPEPEVVIHRNNSIKENAQ